MGRTALRRTPAVVETVEPRILFAYDLAFVDATTTRATYSPGQPISVDFTFRNNGDTPSPATKFFLFLNAADFGDGDDGGDDFPTGYGGTLFEATDNLDIPALGAGETRVLTFARPVGSFVFDGGPYFISVFAGFETGADSSGTFLQNDSDPANNFGQSTSARITIVNGFNPRFLGVSIPESVIGELDTSFGDNMSGVRTNSIPLGDLQTLATSFDPGAGTQYALASRATDLLLLRFDNLGVLDTTFATGGVLTIASGQDNITSAILTRAPDGTLLVAATRALGASALVAKFSPVGVLDTSFGDTGIFTALDQTFVSSSVVAGPGGTVYVVGTSGAPGSRDFAIQRLTASGARDASFGVNGSLTVDVGGDEVAATAVLNNDNSLVVAGSSGSRIAAIRVLATGARDLRFGVRGILSAAIAPGRDERVTVSALGPRGAVYLAGYSAASDGSASTPFVLRLSRAGRPDAAFGRRGVALPNVGSALAVPNTLISTPDGGVLLAAQIADSLSDAASGRVAAAFARFDAKGKPVVNFGTNGVSRILLPGIAPTAVGDTPGDFATFVATRQGAATVVPGGKVRALGSDPGDNSTNVRVAQLSADGVDIAPAFPKPLSASVKAGAKSSVSFRLSNLGTLPASGNLSMSLSLIPVSASPGASGGTIGTSSARVSLAAGSSRNQSLRVTYPRATGLYTLVARVTPTSGFSDLSTDNNSASSPNQLTLSPTGRPLRSSLMPFPPTLIRIGPPSTPSTPQAPSTRRNPPALQPAPLSPLSPNSPVVPTLSPSATKDLFSSTPLA